MIKNQWVAEVEALRSENEDLRLNLFVIRLAWAGYGFLMGLLAAAVMAALWG
jgi:hypothetical protein